MASLPQPRELSTPRADYVLREYDATPPLDEEELPPQARSTVEQDVNQDETRLKIEYQADGTVRLRATQHVGILSLLDGPTIEIRPKVPGTDLLGLIQYGHGITPQTIDRETSITAGRQFIDALATLFEAELKAVLSRGLHREYRRVSEATPHIRGRLDVQRQLQRQGPLPTEFECSYDELTVDTTVNRGVLYATTILQRFVRETSVNRALRRHQQRLRRQVELTSVRPIELERIELTRLMSHYDDLFRLTKLILRSIFIENLRAANRSSFALLINMNEVFEAVVERAVGDAIEPHDGWTVEPQADSTNLVSGGNRSITIRPDVLVQDKAGTVKFVGDAKWKLDNPEEQSREPSTSDIYQLISYQVAHQAPGVIFYPAQRDRVSSHYTVDNLNTSLTLIEIPVQDSEKKQLEEAIQERIQDQLSFPQ